MGRDRGIGEYAQKVIRIKVSQLIGKYGYTESDREDLESELTLHLLERMPQFDPKRAKRNTFVARIIENKVVSILRYRRGQCRDCSLDGQSLDRDTSGENGEAVSYGDLITEGKGRRHLGQEARSATDASDLSIDAEQFISQLPAHLRDLAQRLMTGSSIASIARDVDLSRTVIHRRLKDLRQRAEDAGLKNYLLSG